jgi:hypothetical protein
MDVPEPPEASAAESAWVRIGRRLQELLIALIVYNALPLTPLAVEWLKTGTVSASNLVLGSSMFAITIAFSSKAPLVFTVGIASGFLMATLSALPLPGEHPPVPVDRLAWLVLMMITSLHAWERIVRHLRRGEPALQFIEKEAGLRW